MPDEDGTGATEPSSGTGYARALLTNLSEPVNGEITNEQSISFNESTASWGTITHYVIYEPQPKVIFLWLGSLIFPA